MSLAASAGSTHAPSSGIVRSRRHAVGERAAAVLHELLTTLGIEVSGVGSCAMKASSCAPSRQVDGRRSPDATRVEADDVVLAMHGGGDHGAKGRSPRVVHARPAGPSGIDDESTQPRARGRRHHENGEFDRRAVGLGIVDRHLELRTQPTGALGPRELLGVEALGARHRRGRRLSRHVRPLRRRDGAAQVIDDRAAGQCGGRQEGGQREQREATHAVSLGRPLVCRGLDSARQPQVQGHRLERQQGRGVVGNPLARSADRLHGEQQPLIGE
jgi:hypothetical protein